MTPQQFARFKVPMTRLPSPLFASQARPGRESKDPSACSSPTTSDEGSETFSIFDDQEEFGHGEESDTDLEDDIEEADVKPFDSKPVRNLFSFLTLAILCPAMAGNYIEHPDDVVVMVLDHHPSLQD